MTDQLKGQQAAVNPALYVVGTPIGNRGDLSQRAADLLCSADLICCEDTRRTAPLLKSIGVSGRLASLHQHNERSQIDEVLKRVSEGGIVALVSDAGMPVVSDPGVLLVKAAHQQGLPVIVVPGPSAVTSALAVAGIEGDSWQFVGFLQRKEDALVQQLETSTVTVAFESPQRIAASLQAIAERWPKRQVTICRELTKAFEQVVSGTAEELRQQLADELIPARGEFTVVVSGVEAEAQTLQLEAVVAQARQLVEAGAKAKVACKVVANLSGHKASLIYDLLHQS